MKRAVILVAVIMCTGIVIASETLAFKGRFTWNSRKDQEHDVTAVVEQLDDGTMSITYTAMWKEKPHLYVGTLTGDLQNGTISGTAVTKGGNRNWVVRGKAEKGIITCEHFEIKGTGEAKKEVYTGTVTLQRQ